MTANEERIGIHEVTIYSGDEPVATLHCPDLLTARVETRSFGWQRWKRKDPKQVTRATYRVVLGHVHGSTLYSQPLDLYFGQ